MNRRHCIMAILLVGLIACGEPAEDAWWKVEDPPPPSRPKPSRVAQSNPERCVERFDPDLDYFPHKVSPQHATRFTIDYHAHFKVVTVTVPWGGKNGGSSRERYLLLLCGTPVPPGFGDARQVRIPVERVVTTSASELQHLVDLRAVERLVGHGDFIWVSAPEVRERLESGAVEEVGRAAQIDVQRVVAARPDVVLTASLGGAEAGVIGALRELRVPVAQMLMMAEANPLGRAEWILVTAALLNREALARDVLLPITDRYLELAHQAQGATPRPRVLTGAPLGDTWYVPGGRSFLARLLADAGADYLWADAERAGSLPLALEDVLTRAVAAEVWVHPGAWRRRGEIASADRRLATLEVFRNGQIYSNDAGLAPPAEAGRFGTNAYWENGPSRPDLVLADLIKIFHPELVPDHELVYHRRLE